MIQDNRLERNTSNGESPQENLSLRAIDHRPSDKTYSSKATQTGCIIETCTKVVVVVQRI